VFGTSFPFHTYIPQEERRGKSSQPTSQPASTWLVRPRRGILLYLYLYIELLKTDQLPAADIPGTQDWRPLGLARPTRLQYVWERGLDRKKISCRERESVCVCVWVCVGEMKKKKKFSLVTTKFIHHIHIHQYTVYIYIYIWLSLLPVQRLKEYMGYGGKQTTPALPQMLRDS
jgi:hypothetical protein